METMKHIAIDPERSFVELVARGGAAVEDAVAEAIRFCAHSSLKELTLNYRGFLFDIGPGHSPAAKVAEYQKYLKFWESRRAKVAGSPRYQT